MISAKRTTQSDGNRQLALRTTRQSLDLKMLVDCDIQRIQDLIYIALHILQSFDGSIGCQRLPNCQVINSIILGTDSHMQAGFMWISQDRYTIEEYITEIGLQFATNHVDDRGFSCTVTSEERQCLIRQDVERDVFGCKQLSEELADLRNSQDLRSCGTVVLATALASFSCSVAAGLVQPQ